MASQILRPTSQGQNKQDQPWVIQGGWGRRTYPAGTKTDLYQSLYDELVDAGLLDSTAMMPTRRHHQEVVSLIMHSSWVDGRWILDSSL